MLFRLKKSELKGPLVQFQATVFEKDDVLKLMQSINGALLEHALDPARLEKAFATWWPELENQLNGIVDGPSEPPAQQHLIPAEISNVLEELIDLTRANHKLLREPGLLLPPDLLHDLHFRADRMGFMLNEVDDARAILRASLSLMKEGREDPEGSVPLHQVEDMLMRLEKSLVHISKGLKSALRNRF
ncbi:hypothetical protein D3C84_800440 [compost metagenome]